MSSIDAISRPSARQQARAVDAERARSVPAIETPTRRPRARCRDACRASDRRVEHEQVVVVLVLEHARLGCDVALEAPVPVEVVLGQAEQHRDPRSERLGERELERRHLGDEHIDVVVDRVEQRATDVARRDRAPARRFEHRRGETRDRRLAVGAGDGDDRHASLRSAARSISLRTGTPAAARGDDRGMRLGDERARHDEVDVARPVPRYQSSVGRVDDARARCRSRVSARARYASPPGRSSATTTSQPSRRRPTGDRFAGCGETDDERARITRSRTGGSRRRRCRRRERRRSPENSQNRTITVNSDQPPTSKWWWIGAMRSTRRRKPR